MALRRFEVQYTGPIRWGTWRSWLEVGKSTGAVRMDLARRLRDVRPVPIGEALRMFRVTVFPHEGPVCHGICRTPEDDAAGRRDVLCRQPFVCGLCGEQMACDRGGADDMPNSCDDCWALAHDLLTATAPDGARRTET